MIDHTYIGVEQAKLRAAERLEGRKQCAVLACFALLALGGLLAVIAMDKAETAAQALREQAYCAQGYASETYCHSIKGGN